MTKRSLIYGHALSVYVCHGPVLHGMLDLLKWLLLRSGRTGVNNAWTPLKQRGFYILCMHIIAYICHSNLCAEASESRVRLRPYLHWTFLANFLKIHCHGFSYRSDSSGGSANAGKASTWSVWTITLSRPDLSTVIGHNEKTHQYPTYTSSAKMALPVRAAPVGCFLKEI